MPETHRISLRALALLDLCCLALAVGALWGWLRYRELVWTGIAAPIFVYFDLCFAVLVSLDAWAAHAESEDARRTCTSILRRYRETRSVDDLLFGYELWRLESHGMATRIDFLRVVIDQLISDGYVYEAVDLLGDYEALATTALSRRDYERFRKQCERRMDTILAEAAEQERRWAMERGREDTTRTIYS
jgi:hypothetical protein